MPGPGPPALSVDVDATRLVHGLAELRPRYEASAGVRLSFTDLIVLAATLVALEQPGQLAGPHLPEGPGLDIGLVVVGPDGTPGVITLEEAPARTLVQLAGEREDAGKREVDPEGTGAALLVSNRGPYGIDHFVPGAGPSTAPILGASRVRPNPTGGSSLWVSPSVDARLWCMVIAAGAVGRLGQLLERPTLLAA